MLFLIPHIFSIGSGRQHGHPGSCLSYALNPMVSHIRYILHGLRERLLCIMHIMAPNIVTPLLQKEGVIPCLEPCLA